MIPNWVDTSEIQPQPRRNAWSAEHGLDDEFVVMHSGNIGHAQDLDTLVRAATFLRDLDRLRIMVIGFGARHGELTRLAQRLEVTRHGAVPRLPAARAPARSRSPPATCTTSGSPAASPASSSRAGSTGSSPPGGRCSSPPMRTARPSRIVEEVGCGIVVPPGRPELVASVIRDVAEGRLSLEGMGERGRAWVEREADREVAFGRYRRVVADVVASSSR